MRWMIASEAKPGDLEAFRSRLLVTVMGATIPLAIDNGIRLPLPAQLPVIRWPDGASVVPLPLRPVVPLPLHRGPVLPLTNDDGADNDDASSDITVLFLGGSGNNDDNDDANHDSGNNDGNNDNTMEF